MRTDEREIHDVDSMWIDAVNAGDLARLLTLMTGDVGVSQSRPSTVRPRWIFHCFFSAHKQAVIRCTSELEEVVVVGEVAYTRSRNALSVTARGGGEATQFAGYRITIYRRQPDGRSR